MRDGGSRQWRQMEWIGFYFEFLCKKHLSGMMTIPGPRYGRARFDAFLSIPWDFKAHAINTSSHKVIVNDQEAVIAAVEQYGSVGLVIALGEVQYNDRNRTFQRWHEVVKGGKSQYEIDRIERGAWSRLRKVSFCLKQVCVVEVDESTLERTGTIQNKFRNADGSPRRGKVLLDLEKIRKNESHTMDA